MKLDIALREPLAGRVVITRLDTASSLVTITPADALAARLVITQANSLAQINLTMNAPGSVPDEVRPERYGAVGDGVHDDSDALAAAIATGLPVRLGARTYGVGGQFTIANPTWLRGTRGLSTIKRLSQTGNGAFMAIQAASFTADGVVFDANKAAISTDSWGVLVTAECTAARFTACSFNNAVGTYLGHGLVYLASDPTICRHAVLDCDFDGNAQDGLWVQAVNGIQIIGNRASNNGAYGLNVDYNDATFAQQARRVQIIGNRAWGNVRGINVGNYNATNIGPPTWGPANPDVFDVVVDGNIAHDNAIYGIAVSGQGLLVVNNNAGHNGTSVTNGAQMLANVSFSQVHTNTLRGASTFGLDAGGSIYSDFSDNQMNAASAGMNVGGGISNRVTGNKITACTYAAITVYAVEDDGAGNSFGLVNADLLIASNHIVVSGTTALGVLVLDGAQGVTIEDNDFTGTNGATAAQCVVARTDAVTIGGNRVAGITRHACAVAPIDGLSSLVFPDVADEIEIQSACTVQAQISTSQVALAGQVAFVAITAGGSGYTHATIAIAGAGTGAAATAVISNGTVIGARMTALGSGYGQLGASVAVTITGDGTGATASAIAGVTVPDGRRLRVQCDASVTFAYVGSLPLLDNPAAADLVVPARGLVEWSGIAGAWRANAVPPADALSAATAATIYMPLGGLPIAGTATLGGVVIGAGVTVNAGGTISVAAALVTAVAGRTGAVTLSAADVSGLAAIATSGLTAATTLALGGVMIGSGVTVNAGGTISVAAAPVTSVAGRTGAVTLSAADVSGLNAIATSGLTAATTLALGGVMIGSGVTVNAGGTISVAAAPVTTVAGRTGAVTLSAADVSGLSGTYAPLASPTFTGNVVHSVTSGVTAAGTSQAGATALTSDFNEVTTVAVGANSVVLPNLALGAQITVRNAQGSAALLVYPPSGHSLDIGAANNPFSMGANSTKTFRKMAATKWYSQ